MLTIKEFVDKTTRKDKPPVWKKHVGLAMDSERGYCLLVFQENPGLYSLTILVNNDPDYEGGCCIHNITLENLMDVSEAANLYAQHMEKKFTEGALPLGSVEDSFVEYDTLEIWLNHLTFLGIDIPESLIKS